MPLNVMGIIMLGIVVLNISLGILVLLKNPKGANNIVYALSVSSIALWVLFTYFYNNPVLINPAQWLKLVYLSSYGMLISQMIFAYYFPKKVPDNFFLYTIPIFITLIPSFYVLMIENSVVISAVNFSEKFLSVAEMGNGYLLYTLPNVLGILLIAPYFYTKSKQFIGYEKAQVHFYILGALFMMVPLVILDYGIPLITGDTSFFVYGPLFAIPFSISLAYSILENRYVTIKVILRSSLYFVSILIYVLGCLFLFLNLYTRDYFNGTYSYLIIGIFCTLSILVYMFIYRPLFVQLLNTFSQDSKKRGEILRDFSQVSNIELTVDRIAINIKRTIKQIFMIEKVGIILFDKRDFSIRYKYLNDFKIVSMEYLIQIVQNWDDISEDTILVADEVRREMVLNEKDINQRLVSVINFMNESNISAVIPFNSRTQLNGVVLLGYRSDKYPLSIEEINLLNEIVSSISVSIGRAVLYQEVQVFSSTLQQKVNEQTKELQIKVQQLEEARRKESDMIDIMGHELRTPATIVKLNADMLEKYIDSNPEEFKKYVNRIKDAIENEIRLINTLLSSAKLEGTKVEINKERINIRKEIEMALYAYEKEAEKKGIKIENLLNSDTPNVYADKARTVEILNNLIDNAIKYTDKGSITIKSEYNEDFVTVSIKDTGKGIPKEEIPKLGQKFHRVENYLGSNKRLDIVRPGGTGLGLYVTFKLVELMGGKIYVKSEVNVGSEFVFTLPVFKGENETKEGEDSKNMFEKLGLKH